MTPGISRRPLKTREKKWANALAGALIQRKIQPNHISLLGIGCAILAAFCFAAHIYLLAAVFIQLRLLCNMLDGMVAMGGRHKSKLGDLYNEIPDRVEDAIILLSAGFSVSSEPYLGELFGISATVLALITAYIRALGGSLGTKQYFQGPMAKPHRMFTMTVACLLEVFTGGRGYFMLWGLIVVIFGGLLTCGRRIYSIARELKQR